MRVLIVGATAGLGRCLAEEAARRGHDLLLSATDSDDLAAMAAHLRLVCSVQCEYVACRLGSGNGEAAILEAAARLGPIDGILYPVGYASEDDTGMMDAGATKALMDINCVSQMRLTAALWPVLVTRPASFVVGFGSVAAIRGRRRNVVYAAAKRALLSYFESLRHMAVGTPVRIQFYQLGYLDTQQTLGKKLLFPKASPAEVARMVLDRTGRDAAAVYYPGFWRPLAVLLRLLPWFVYRKLNF